MTGFNGLANAGRCWPLLTHAQIVYDDDLSRLQRRGQLLGDVPLERFRIHGSLNHPRHLQALRSERGHQRRVFAVIAGHGSRGPSVMRRPTIEPS